MLVLTLRESVTGLTLVSAIGPMLGGALVGLLPSIVYQITALVVMSLTVNCAPLFPVIAGLATWKMNSAVTIGLSSPMELTLTALISRSGAVVTLRGTTCVCTRPS